MTKRETSAFRASLHHAANMALIAALTLELRDDGTTIRQRAAIEALRGRRLLRGDAVSDCIA